ncbi:MAG: PAS domain-containing protein [Pseudomonadota bacterium]
MATEIPQAIQDVFDEVQIPLTLSDPRAEDDPLLLANDAFLRMTGYELSEIRGRNCRFLQGSETQTAMIRQIKTDLEEGRDSRVLLTNYRKSGEAFDNFLYVFAVRDDGGTPRYRIGSQFEIPALARATAFEDHARALAAGLDAINAASDAAHHYLIQTGEAIGLSVKALLTARLTTLRDSV